jgi:anti-anti-sigma factor
MSGRNPAVGDRPLVVETQVVDGTTRVMVRGEVDISTVAELQDGLAKAVAADPRCLVVDLRATGFIDCAGMRALAQLRRDAPGGMPVVLRPSSAALRVLELTGLDRLFVIDRLPVAP